VIPEINTREPVAYARKDIADFRETYHIYMEGAAGRIFYALGTLRQSIFKLMTAMKASNGKIRCVILPCMIPFVCPRWHLKVYNVNDRRILILSETKETTPSL
jgi:hypothetical protein